MIVIDPGHGGIDNGTRAAGGEHQEKAIVLDFALLLRDQLEKSGKYRVSMTRTDDTFVPLDERVRFARAAPGALFISIHADALRAGEGDAQGATIYTLSDTASDAEAARLAEAENRADVIAGIDLTHEPGDVADILIDLAQRETKTFSMHFAKTLVGELKTVMRLHKHPLKSAGFKVLQIARRAFGAGRARLCVEQGRSEGADVRQPGANRRPSHVQAVDAFFRTRMAGTAEARGERQP